MPPKTPPSAGARKKIVKTVRKTVPKAKTPLPETTPPATAADAAPEPVATPITTPDATAATEATVTRTSSTSPPPPDTSDPDVTPKASEVAPTETLEAEPVAPTETLQAEPTAPTETIEAEPVAPETTPEPSDPTAAKPPAKTTTRVRKVVKKKIIVKRIPKLSTVAEEGKEVEEKAVAIPAAAAESPSSDAAAGKASAQQEMVEVAANLASGDGADAAAAGDGDAEMTEGRRRRKTEIFVGGLDRDAKEEDLRKVFGRAGEVVEVRMMMDGKTGKNKGYAFLRYAESAQAKKAVAELAKVEVCGKICGAAALEGKDTIFLGNIDKKWTKDDIIKLLQENGIEKIDNVTVMVDPNNAELNRGFAFLELETNRDAQLAYKKLQKKDAFGKGRNVKIAWAEPLNDPDEEEMQKVKSVYVDGIPPSWDEDKVRESFKKFGEIERVVLARNIQSAKRKDFAFVNYTTREAARSCIESFDKEGLTDNGSKVNVKVSLAKPVHKGKQNKGGSKSSNKDKFKEKPKAVQSITKVDVYKGKPLKAGHTTNGGDKKSSTTHELLNVLREQAAWKQDHIGSARGPTVQDYTHTLPGGKRPFSALGDDTPYSDLRGYPRARLDSSFPVTSSSYHMLPHGTAASSLPYHHHQGVGYPSGPHYLASDYSSTLQRKQGGPPYGSNLHSRY